MIRLNSYIILFLLVILIIVNYWLYQKPNIREGVDSNINYYAFTRMNKKSVANAENQKSNIGRPLRTIRYTSMQKKYSKFDYFQQMGMLQSIVRKMDNDDATFLSVFFEDGFRVTDPGLNNALEKIVNDFGETDYDFLLLGANPNLQGQMVKPGVYKITGEGSFSDVYGYIINNMNLGKMVSRIKKTRGTSLLERIYNLHRKRSAVVLCLYPGFVTGSL